MDKVKYLKLQFELCFLLDNNEEPMLVSQEEIDDLMKENKQLNKVKLNDTTTLLTSTEITPEILAQVRKIRLESARNNPRTINFKSDKKPSFPGYKANYMI